ncbi:S1 RNA-binding domain-containing protein [Pseudarthrobacter oxydans]|uniref:S1 RNA-binding domain-containing protein n=1 Tax=Pseudarthrobacter oxydans TaxID=1671 RepID=UPI0015737E6A|nr:S1 RNA-binding domain-containing protein [Pseudarthrobacter oxydans]
MYSYFFERTHAPEEGVIFVEMPFGVKDGYDFDRFYNGILVPLLRRIHLKPERSDGIYGPVGILELIIRSIQRAEIVIVDLSAASVNVGYELCAAQFYGKRCVFIAMEGSKIPTDLPNNRVLWYSPTNDVFAVHTFEEQLTAQIEALRKEPAEEMGPVRYVGMTRVPGTVKDVKPEYATVMTSDGDLGFLTGADIDYTRVYDDLTKRLKIGEHLNGGFVIDPVTQRPKYSLLNAEDNPWPRIASAYPLGTAFRGTVVSTSAVGAFVRIVGRVNGLVLKRSFPSGLPAVGEELDVEISRVDLTSRRVGLELQHPRVPVPLALPQVGEHFEAVVDRVVPVTAEGRGGYALLELEGYKRRGLLLAKNMTPELREDFDKGLLQPEEIITVEVISVDREAGKMLLRDLEDQLSEPRPE